MNISSVDPNDPAMALGSTQQAETGNEAQHGAPEGAATVSADRVEISEKGRQRAREMQAGAGGDSPRESRQSGVAFGGGQGADKAGDADKEEAVDELEDKNSDIKKKKEQLQSAKVSFTGTDEEQAREIKRIEQDLRDLEDERKDIEGQLAT